jgi:hypothetical protein
MPKQKRPPGYHSWQNMRRRCSDPKNQDFHNYGGRGIQVCERWSSYQNFITDMGEPSPGQSIDRIDPNLGYQPGNCKWADSLTQSTNRRHVKKVGDESLKTYCRERGMNYSAIQARIARGWSVEQALSTPVRPMKGREEWTLAR